MKGYSLWTRFNMWTQDIRLEGDMIIHPKHGTYPREVEFKDGMAILPYQSAHFMIKVNPQAGTVELVDDK